MALLILFGFAIAYDEAYQCWLRFRAHKDTAVSLQSTR